LRRGGSNCGPFFPDCFSAVEIVLGESYNSGRIIEQSTDFRSASYALEPARESRRSKSPAPIRDQGVFCARLVGNGNSLRILRFPSAESKLLAANSVPSASSVSRA
jgi:hypothetical protein